MSGFEGSKVYENNDGGLSDLINKLTDNVDISLDEFKLAGDSIQDGIINLLKAMKEKGVKSISIDTVNVLEIKSDNEFIVLFGGDFKKSNTIESVASQFEQVSNKIEGEKSYSQNIEKTQHSRQKTKQIEQKAESILFNPKIKNNNNWNFKFK